MTTLGRSQSAAGMAFGLLEALTLPGPVLVKVMTDLEITEPAARATLARMVRSGELESNHHGRIALYRLSGRHLKLFKHIRENPVGPPWTGQFHTVLYDIAESDRRMRDLVRRRAFDHGYGSPRPGVLIGMLDRSDWVTELRQSAMMLEVGTFRCDFATARRLVNRAWNLTEISSELDATCRRLEQGLARDEPVPTVIEAVRALCRLWVQLSQVHQKVPLLPKEFLPNQWAVNRLYELTYAASDRYAQALGEYQQQVIDTWPHADLIEHARTLANSRDPLGTPASQRWLASNAIDAYSSDSTELGTQRASGVLDGVAESRL